jgi:hypothetical protein
MASIGVAGVFVASGRDELPVAPLLAEAAEVAGCCSVAEDPAGATCSIPPSRGAILASLRSVPVEEPSEGAPTYTKDVAPLIQKHCQECHRSGKIAPFSLTNYEEAKRQASNLATVTLDRRMPPWLADPDYGQKFRHDRSLSEAEIQVFQDWLDAGTPEGDPADLPPAPTFPEGWKLGEPDLVIELPEEYEIPADGADIYRCFVIPNPLPEDAEIIGLEYQPGNARVVHHILGYIDTTGQARELDAAEEGAGYTCFGGPRINVRGDLGGWAPGADADYLPDGIGRVLPKGADIVLQVHYHATGKPEKDRTRLGLYLAPKGKPIKQAMHWWAAGPDYAEIKPVNREGGGLRFEIPEGADNHRIVARTLPLPCDLEIVAVSPHMHKIGKDMEMFAVLPESEGRPGEKVPLIRISSWDFNWQLQYQLAEPLRLPAGTVIHAVAHFDNKDNPNKEGGPGPVLEGEATYEEMCFGFFAAVKAGQDLTKGDKDDLQELFYGQLRELERAEHAKARERSGQASDE